MLGWLITVYRITDEPAVRQALATPGGKPVEKSFLGARLAVWQAGLGGLDWIQAAARAPGGIERVHGYPSQFLVRAGDVLPTLRARRNGPPMSEHRSWVLPADSTTADGYLEQGTFDLRAIQRCADDEWLIVEAWDES